MGGPALPAAASPVAGEPVGLGAGPRRLRLAASHLLRDGVDGRHRVVGVDDGPDRLGLGRGCDGAGLQEMLFRRMLAPGGNRAASDRTPQWPQYLNATVLVSPLRSTLRALLRRWVECQFESGGPWQPGRRCDSGGSSPEKPSGTRVHRLAGAAAGALARHTARVDPHRNRRCSSTRLPVPRRLPQGAERRECSSDGS